MNMNDIFRVSQAERFKLVREEETWVYTPLLGEPSA